MKWVILSIYDVKVAGYMRPMFAPALGAGVRAFGDEVNRQGGEMHAHPEDYSLFNIGEFDDNAGVVTPLKPVLVVQAAAVLRVVS